MRPPKDYMRHVCQSPYTRITPRLLQILLILILCSATVAVGKATKAGRQAQGRKSAETTLQRPFDTSVQKLPPGFTGNSIDAVLRQNTLAPQGEFETTAEYEARKTRFSVNTYAFVLEDPFHNRDLFTYSPDAGAFTIHLLKDVTTIANAPDDYKATVFDVGIREVSKSKFVGTNEYGAKAAVTRDVLKITQVVTHDSLDATDNGSNVPTEYMIRMPPERAKTVKSRLRVLLVCSPKAEQYKPDPVPHVPDATGRYIIDATVHDPKEEWKVYVALRANILQLWAFDSVTGEIYGRFLIVDRRAGSPQ